MAYDTVIPGFRTNNTNTLRLWSSEPNNEFDLSLFNQGNYYKSVEKQQSAALISSVLYPNDNNPEGKELRFKQQYFFCSATLQDIIRRFRKSNKHFENFADKVVIQLNDTHPTIAIVELMRLLLDVEGLSWDHAYSISQKTFAYTNHTVLPEALERWSLEMVTRVLPRHIEIIYEINRIFLETVAKRWPGDSDRLRRLSIIDENSPKMVRMAHLAIIMAFKVNGVAAIHSEILKKELFRDFYELYPEKFINITNGVTPRRWLYNCNPELSSIISKRLNGEEWLTNLDMLTMLKQYSDDPMFQAEWMAVKMHCKKRLSDYLAAEHNIFVDPNALFDIQIKRIHEYKRQLMNILRVIHQYLELKRKVVLTDTIVPKVIIFAGKAAPGYHRAKLIIKLINSVAEKINADKKIKDLLKVFFIPNYSVSLAELIIPASDISEHISTAGMEASGTSNMKFAINGGLIIGTHDGANIEIAEAMGEDNMFMFGLKADRVEARRKANATLTEVEDPHLQDAVDAIESGMFGPREHFVDIINSLLPGKKEDYYKYN
jgi:starch phosphorylase